MEARELVSDAHYRLGPSKCGSLHMEGTDFSVCIQFSNCEHMKSDIVVTETRYKWRTVGT
jgi:hypothetical protein